MVWVRRAVLLVVAALIVGGAVYALLPSPVQVDLGPVDRGTIEVTVDEEGMARIADVYQVSSPVAGQLERFPLKVGDSVKRGVTIIGEIRPAQPAFLDVRSRRELEAAVDAARAAVELARAELTRSQAEARLADADLDRAERLAGTSTISARALEKAVLDAQSAQAQVQQSQANLQLRQSELASAEARLIQPDQTAGENAGSCCVLIRPPVDGVVLKVMAENAQVVAAGTPIAQIGNPSDLEVVVDLLSSDAVRVRPGAEAYVEGWGGGEILPARVRRVDPAAFTKVSALGIEEQRVNTVLDLVAPAAQTKRLGHEYRVDVRIVLWRGEVVRVPLAALFRQGADWAVFKVVDGKAALTRVKIDHRNTAQAEVTAGLSPGDVVILHPSDRVEDGIRVASRTTDRAS
ncbi:efflux RND transporter periplasmic adaptor subunit [Propylenella binzhouense]|uniref:HlyD family efflux transporter periplasmic adaptor subunit n=1 Tax=Propylenella binzhouense TaxID=2555902 RepID=A0A964WTV3_9HYPH|nr:HlyD family efflux transporter periplasmic adaptor subunit [Propylenella binzhouense]MYZ48200.1 HlyD family efflux transporter periplasmic adaptor subunit [Propylenella binzhouense]